MAKRTIKAYGNLTNRIEENKNYNEDNLIHVGDDITKYWYSDRSCYYVTEIIDQKHIKIKRYHVCADHSKDGGMGHQNWLYFKTKKEEQDYLKTIFTDREYDEEPKEEIEIELVYKYGKWKSVETYDNINDEDMFGRKLKDWFFTEKEIKKLENGKPVYRYNDFGNISFGVRDYYYDWTF